MDHLDLPRTSKLSAFVGVRATNLGRETLLYKQVGSTQPVSYAKVMVSEVANLEISA